MTTEYKSELIKDVWYGDLLKTKPSVVFLTDGTKISIRRLGKSAWLEIGQAAKIVENKTKP